LEEETIFTLSVSKILRFKSIFLNISHHHGEKVVSVLFIGEIFIISYRRKRLKFLNEQFQDITPVPKGLKVSPVITFAAFYCFQMTKQIFHLRHPYWW